MALNYNQVDAITEKYFLPTLANNWLDSNPITKRAKEKFYRTVDGGERIVMPLGYASNSASGWFDGSDLLSTTDNNTITAAELYWKQLYGNITISRKEELQNSGKAQIISLVKSKMKNAEQTMIDKMGTALWNDGTTTDALIGNRAWLSTSNTVGGIDQSANSFFQAQVDSTTTTLSLAAMKSITNLATVDNMAPTVCFTTRTIHDLFYALLQPQQRFADAKTADAGFKSLLFQGVPVIADSHATAAHMIFLNEEYCHLFYHKDENMRKTPFQSPNNQNIKTSKIFWAGAYGINNPRLQGALTAITG